MAVTYIFSANTRIRSAEVNQNFTDCVSPYTSWGAFSATWDTNADGTLSAKSESVSRYMRMGDTVWFYVDVSHTISGATANTTAIRFTLPINTTSVINIFSCLTYDPALDSNFALGQARHIHSVAANRVYVYRMTKGNTLEVFTPWTNGTGREVVVQGCYEII